MKHSDNNKLILVLFCFLITGITIVSTSYAANAEESSRQNSFIQRIIEYLTGNESGINDQSLDLVPTEYLDRVLEISRMHDPDSSSGSGSSRSSKNIWTGDLPDVDYKDYGLDKYLSDAEKRIFDDNVNSLLEQLQTEPQSVWARDCLYYEKVLEEKGAPVNPYLLCAWVWFEGALDPYAINCKDNPNQEKRQSVALPCESVKRSGDKNTMLQVGGYQAFDKAALDEYVKYAEMCYEGISTQSVVERDNTFASVLQEVYDNSELTTNEYFSYVDQQNNGLVAKYRDQIDSVIFDEVIARSRSDMDVVIRALERRDLNTTEQEEKNQFFTLLLGKDPCMRVGLNAAATYTLPQDIESKSWARYVRKRASGLATRLEALRKYDQQLQEDGSIYVSGTGPVERASFEGPFGRKQFQQFCQCDATWSSLAFSRDVSSTCGPGLCGSGCGLATMAFVFSNLGVNVNPVDACLNMEVRYWNRSVGMMNNLAALNDTWVSSKGFVVASGNLVWDGKLQVNYAEKYFYSSEYRGRCLIVGSQSYPYNHIFPVVDVDTETQMVDVRDTWRMPVCEPGSHLEISNVQPPSYVNRYAYAVCLDE